MSPQYEPELAIEIVVKARREALHLSQRELGRRACLSPTYVHALEHGTIVPTLASFSRLMVQLRLTPMEIFLLVTNEANRNRTPK